jgi:hypothetical protein
MKYLQIGSCNYVATGIVIEEFFNAIFRHTYNRVCEIGEQNFQFRPHLDRITKALALRRMVWYPRCLFIRVTC